MPQFTVYKNEQGKSSSETNLKTMELIRLSRLSVSKVTDKEFDKVLQMSEESIINK